MAGESATGAGESTPPGWYPDPNRGHEQRYWDGAAWTDYVADRGQSTDERGVVDVGKREPPWYRRPKRIGLAACIAVGAAVLVVVVKNATDNDKPLTRNAIISCLRDAGVAVEPDSGALLSGVTPIGVGEDGSFQGAFSALVAVFPSEEEAKSLTDDPTGFFGEAEARGKVFVTFAPSAPPDVRSAIDACVPPGP